MSVDATDLLLARLGGVLKAFEWFNNKCDHYCTYEVHCLPQAADVETALATHFGQRPADFSVVRNDNTATVLRNLFARYLFLFREPEGRSDGRDCLVDPRRNFQLMSPGGPALVLGELEELTRPLGVAGSWSVWTRLSCGPVDLFCEGNFQDNVVVQLPDRLCLFHFGVSD